MTNALLVIDVQKAFEQERNMGFPWANPAATDNIAGLIGAFRAKGLPVIHIHHHTDDPEDTFFAGGPGVAAMDCAAPRPDEQVFIKTGSSAFIGTALGAHLDALGRPMLTIVGGAANYCIDTTTRMAGNLGHDAQVVEDALLHFPKTLRDGRVMPADDVLALTLANLSGTFARVFTTDALLKDLAS